MEITEAIEYLDFLLVQGIMDVSVGSVMILSSTGLCSAFLRLSSLLIVEFVVTLLTAM